MNDFPCRGCKPPDRYAGCHGRCKKYLESKEEHERMMEQHRREVKGCLDAWSFFRDSLERLAKRNHKRGEWKGSE
jgi:hypothetical protein